MGGLYLPIVMKAACRRGGAERCSRRGRTGRGRMGARLYKRRRDGHGVCYMETVGTVEGRRFPTMCNSWLESRCKAGCFVATIKALWNAVATLKV